MLKFFTFLAVCFLSVADSATAKLVVESRDRYAPLRQIAREATDLQIANLGLPSGTTREQLDTIIFNQVRVESAERNSAPERNAEFRLRIWKRLGIMCGLKINATIPEINSYVRNLHTTDSERSTKINSYLIMELMLGLAKETGRPITDFYDKEALELEALIDAL
jgi:hypothetical protein